MFTKKFSKMRLLVLTASLWALALAKPEMYKESEDFQYSRSSTDEGSKSGFYGAQRGNMGGNYEKSHNMDSLAQHHMSTLVRQVDGELGEGANTRTGSVYTGGNSRGIFGSGNYDLSNLKGRNFGESGYNGGSQLSMYQNGYHGSYGANSGSYGSEQHSSSSKQSGYTASNVASQYSASNVESGDKYQNANSYDYGSHGGSDLGYYSLANSQARNEYDQSNANLYSAYGSSNNNRLVATPVKVYVRPGGRVAVPISAQTYALHSASLQDKNVASAASDVSTSDIVSNSGVASAYKPTSNAKHYQSAYSYHKKWEKHDTQPLAIVPTENPFPANSELYEDRLDEAGQQYQNGLDASSHLSNVNSGYSAKKNYGSEAASHTQSSQASSAYSSGYSNTKSASAQQARYQTQALNKEDTAGLNAYSLDGHNLGASTSNLNSLVEDINSKPKSYHSAYSYHKSWERRGDPYVIVPAGDASAQTSQRLTAASKNQDQYSSQQYGGQYDQNSYSSDGCDIICHQRRKRSYNMNQYEQNADDGQSYLGQQVQNDWDLGQQTENRFEHLEDLGQETQNTWDNLANFGQQTQNSQQFGQEIQKLEKFDDLGQQTEHDFGQQTENEMAKLEEFSQESQKPASEMDLGQQIEDHWSKLGDLGQQTEHDFGQQTENEMAKLEELGQESQKPASEMELGQQTEDQWSKLENLGQQTQNQWNEYGQRVHSQWKDYGQQIHNEWDQFGNLQKQAADRGSQEENFKSVSEVNINTTQQDTVHDKDENIKPKTTDHKFLWDEISQMFEEPPKSEILTSDKHFKENEQPINNVQESLSTESSLSVVQNEHDEFHKTPTNPFGMTLGDKQTEKKPNVNQKLWDALDGLYQIQNQGSHFGHEIEQKWSQVDLDQQTQNQWIDLGQQTQNEWSDLGKQTQNMFSDLSQQTQNQWSDLGQQTQHEWSDLGQQTQNQWSDLSQQTQNEYSDLGQQTQNQWSDLGKQTQNMFSDLSQQTQNQWNDLGQQTQNQWNDLSQQTQNEWSASSQHFHHQWSGANEQSHKQWNYFDNIDHQIQSNTNQQQNIDQDKSTVEQNSEAATVNKDMSRDDQQTIEQTQQTENLHTTDNKQTIHNDESLSQLSPNMIEEQDNSISTTTQKELPAHHLDIGRGDMGADIESFDIEPMSSTTKKPKNKQYRRPNTHRFGDTLVLQPISEKQNLDPQSQNVLSPKPMEDQLKEQKESQIVQQNVDLQQNQQSWDVSESQKNYETYVSPSVHSHPTQDMARSLAIEPQQEVMQQQNLEINHIEQLAEREKKHESENLQSTTEKPIQVETPIEPPTEKPGFWGSVWNKTKKAKDTVSSWFKG